MALRWEMLLAVALTGVLAFAVAACGSDSSTSASTEAASTEAAGEEGGESGSTEVPYDGPEQGLPAEFPEPESTGEGDCKIGYQNIFAAIPSLAEQQKGAEEEAKRLGCDLITLDDQLTPTTQVNNFNQLLAQSVDAIVVYPIVPEALGPSIKEASAKEIPVVANSTPPAADEPLPEGYATRVLQGFDTAAYVRAQYIAENHPGAKFAVIGLAQPVASLQYLAKRSIYWGEQFGLEYLGQVDAQDDNPGSASTAMSAVLGKYPDVEAVFAYNDNTAVAASTVAKSSQADVAICGSNGQSDAFKAIEDGKMACTALGDFVGMGEQMVRGAYDLITEQGGELPESVLAKQTLVDASNVESLTPIG